MIRRTSLFLLAVLVVFFLSAPAWAAVPKLVTMKVDPNEDSIAAAGVPLTFFFPEGSQSGNLLLIWIFSNTGTTLAANAVTDDQSQTWTPVYTGTSGC